MIYLNSVLSLAFLAVVPTQASFEDSPVSTKLGEISNEAIDALDIDVQENNRNIKHEVSERTFARSGGVDMSLLETFKFVPYSFTEKIKCSSQEFGVSGDFTDCVCGVHDVLDDICDAEPTSCIKSSIQGVLAGKSALLQNHDYLSWAFCAVSNGFDTDICEVGNLPQAETYALAARGVDFIVGMTDDGFNNPLFTAGMDLAGSFAPANSINKVLGDGALDLKADVYDRLHPNSPLNSQLVEIDVKLTVLDALLDQYTGRFTDLDKDCFYLDAVRGVIVKKYKNLLLPDMQATKAVDVSRLKFKTHCAMSIGIHAARRCGYDTGDMYDLMVYYFNNKLRPNAPDEHTQWCQRFKPHKYNQAKLYMNTDGMSSTKAASPAECLTLLNL